MSEINWENKNIDERPVKGTNINFRALLSGRYKILIDRRKQRGIEKTKKAVIDSLNMYMPGFISYINNKEHIHSLQCILYNTVDDINLNTFDGQHRYIMAHMLFSAILRRYNGMDNTWKKSLSGKILDTEIINFIPKEYNTFYYTVLKSNNIKNIKPCEPEEQYLIDVRNAIDDWLDNSLKEKSDGLKTFATFMLENVRFNLIYTDDMIGNIAMKEKNNITPMQLKSQIKNYLQSLDPLNEEWVNEVDSKIKTIESYLVDINKTKFSLSFSDEIRSILEMDGTGNVSKSMVMDKIKTNYTSPDEAKELFNIALYIAEYYKSDIINRNLDSACFIKSFASNGQPSQFYPALFGVYRLKHDGVIGVIDKYDIKLIDMIAHLAQYQLIQDIRPYNMVDEDVKLICGALYDTHKAKKTTSADIVDILSTIQECIDNLTPDVIKVLKNSKRFNEKFVVDANGKKKDISNKVKISMLKMLEKDIKNDNGNYAHSSIQCDHIQPLKRKTSDNNNMLNWLGNITIVESDINFKNGHDILKYRRKNYLESEYFMAVNIATPLSHGNLDYIPPTGDEFTNKNIIERDEYLRAKMIEMIPKY